MSEQEINWEYIANLKVQDPMDYSGDARITIKEYLRLLLWKVWTEQEGFSGKRPFGDSGWQYDVYAALALGGVMRATFDGDGYLEKIDEKQANIYIVGLISHIFFEEIAP